MWAGALQWNKACMKMVVFVHSYVIFHLYGTGRTNSPVEKGWDLPDASRETWENEHNGKWVPVLNVASQGNVAPSSASSGLPWPHIWRRGEKWAIVLESARHDVVFLDDIFFPCDGYIIFIGCLSIILQDSSANKIEENVTLPNYVPIMA